MNVKFKRFLSSVMAMVMLMATFTIGNGSAVFADDDLGEMAISDLNIEETPADTATDTSATDDEPLFVNLGDVTADEAMINLAADTTTTKTWTKDTASDNTWVSGLGTTEAEVTQTGSFSDGVSWNSGDKYTQVDQNGNFSISTDSNVPATVKIYAVSNDNSKTGTISVTDSEGSTVTVTNSTAPNRKTSNAAVPTVTLSKANTTYTVNISGGSSKGFALLRVDYTYTNGGGTEEEFAAVSISESPAEGGTFKLTGGNDGAELNDDNSSSSSAFSVGGNYTLTVTPADGYEVSSVTYNGATVTGSDGTYDISISDATVNIVITYKDKATTTVTTTETTSETTTTEATSKETTSETTTESTPSNGLVVGTYQLNKNVKVNGLDISNAYDSDNNQVKVRDKKYIAITPAVSGTIALTWSSNAPLVKAVVNGVETEVTLTTKNSVSTFAVTAGTVYKVYGSKSGSNTNLTQLVLVESTTPDDTTSESTSEATTKEATTETTTVAQTGTLTIKSTNAPAGAGYIIKDSTGKTLTATSTDTYTLTDGATYDLDVNGVSHYSNKVTYNGTDISDTGVFTYSKDATELTIVYTEDAKHTVTVNVTSDDDSFDYTKAIPLVDGTALTASNSATVTYTYNDYKGTTHTITAPDVSGYTKTITSNGSDISSFTVADGLVINIEYNKVVVSANDSWNFNNLDSITANSENTLTGSNGTELIYKADSSDKISGSTSNSYTTGIGTQNGKGIAPGGPGNTSKRYFTLEIEPNATFTMYYVRNAKNAAAYIASSSAVLATGNTVTTATDLGTVSYTNTTSNTMTIYCYGDSNKPIFIGATLSGTITSFGPIVVKVVDEDGNAVTDATVKVGNATISKSASGEYTFNGLFTTAVKATVSKTGYVTTESEAFTKAETKTVTLNKVTAITVSGTVTDKDTGVSLSSATVTLTFTDGTSKSVTTSTDGKFSFADVSNLKSITISCDGYVTYTKSFTGSETANQTVDTALNKTSNTVTVKFYSTGDTVSNNVMVGKTSDAITINAITNKTKEYTIKDVEPGTKLYFKSMANNVFEWYPYVNDGTNETILDSASYITYTQNGSSNKYFTYTVPSNATAGYTYGVKFVADNSLKNTLNTADYNTSATGTIGYGQYGLGDDKIRINAGKANQLTDAQIEHYSNYNARIYFRYAFIKPSLEDYSKGYSDKKYNSIVGTTYVQNANQYGILRNSFDTAPTGDTANVAKPFVSFTPSIEGLSDTDTIDVLIDVSGGNYSVYPVNDSTNALTGITKGSKMLYKLTNNVEYAITADSSTKVYLKSVRIYDPNNIMANNDTTGVTAIGGSSDPNFYVEDMGTVADLSNTTFGDTVLNGLSSVQNPESYKVFRIVSRIVVPSAGRENVGGYIDGVETVGYDVYDTTTYNTLNASSTNSYNAQQQVDSSLNATKATADEAGSSAIEFEDTVNTAVMGLKKDDTAGYVNAGNIADLSSVTTYQLLCGNVKVSEASWYDLYVQTFIAVKADASITLVPYTQVNGTKSYTVVDKDNNVAKVINPQSNSSEG
ncbi:MAG: carboxypeptidase regulatory-like domain-containing protein [Lachnospirales bacterium]